MRRQAWVAHFSHDTLDRTSMPELQGTLSQVRKPFWIVCIHGEPVLWFQHLGAPTTAVRLFSTAQRCVPPSDGAAPSRDCFGQAEIAHTDRANQVQTSFALSRAYPSWQPFKSFTAVHLTSCSGSSNLLWEGRCIGSHCTADVLKNLPKCPFRHLVR